MKARALVLAALLGACAADPSARWQDYQSELLRYGYLRAERAPRDVTYTNEDLLRAFRRIMFYDEYVLVDGVYRPGLSERGLEKRTAPVTYTMAGAGVTEADRRNLDEIALRLANATHLPVMKATDRASIHIFIAGPEERAVFADILASRRGEGPLVSELRNNLGGNVCIAVPFRPKNGREDTSYLIFIPDEVKGRLRRACIEEEFAQAFGPAADFEGARPSIFNDDQEFALLTEHDTWMFRVLYDPRLTPGMAESEAMPVARRILAEIRPEE